MEWRSKVLIRSVYSMRDRATCIFIILWLPDDVYNRQPKHVVILSSNKPSGLLQSPTISMEVFLLTVFFGDVVRHLSWYPGMFHLIYMQGVVMGNQHPPLPKPHPYLLMVLPVSTTKDLGTESHL